MTAGAVPDLRDVFARPWSGPATIWRPWWLRWWPVASHFHFHTEISNVAEAATSGLVVHDTATFPNGKTWQRTMRARLVAPAHWKVSATDMPGGAEARVTADGFRFTPYTILPPVLGPIRVPLRFVDEVRFVDANTMTDKIEMRFLRLHVGTVTIHLVRN